MPNKNTALLIVDMQKDFETAGDIDTQNGVIAQIKRAIKKEIPIFVLEYDGYGDTHDVIKTLLYSYYDVHYIEKDRNDGGFELMEYIDCNGSFNIKHFITCGVNISFCVGETIRTLIYEFGKKVLLIANASNCEIPKEEALQGFYGKYDMEEVFDDNRVAIIQ